MALIGRGHGPGDSSPPDPAMPPCEVCFEDDFNCQCPECDVCGEAGNFRCYAQGRFVNHGLVVTPEMAELRAEQGRLMDLAAEMEEEFWRRKAEDYQPYPSATP